MNTLAKTQWLLTGDSDNYLATYTEMISFIVYKIIENIDHFVKLKDMCMIL